MTIPLHQRNNIRLYSHINGFHNLGFITGIYHESIPNQPAMKDVIWIQQLGFNNLNLAMPVQLNPAKGVLVPSNLKPGMTIMCRVRLERGHISSPIRSIIPRALTVERPNILADDADELFGMSLEPDDQEQKKVFTIPSQNFVESMTIVHGQNNCSIAGFLFAKHLEETPSRRLCLKMLIQQTENPDDSLHVRIYAKSDKNKSMLQLCHKKAVIGRPYFFKGSYRVNPSSDPTQPNNPDGSPACIKYGYLHCEDIVKAHPGTDIPFPFPGWAETFRANIAAVTQRS